MSPVGGGKLREGVSNPCRGRANGRRATRRRLAIHEPDGWLAEDCGQGRAGVEAGTHAATLPAGDRRHRHVEAACQLDLRPALLAPSAPDALAHPHSACDGRRFLARRPRGSTMTVLPTGPTSISSGKRSGKGARAVALTARLTRRSRSVYICWRWQGSGDRSASCSATRRRPRDHRALQTPRRCAAPPRPIPDLAPGRMPRGTRDMREPAPPSRPSRPRLSGDRHPQHRSGPLATAFQRRTVRVTPRPFLPHSRSPGPSPGRPPGRRATTAPQRPMLVTGVRRNGRGDDTERRADERFTDPC